MPVTHDGYVHLALVACLGPIQTSCMTTPQETRVAVLGLGHMGRAIATRLAPTHHIASWNRTDAIEAPGSVATSAEAVDGADVVLLCLFDAMACFSVLSDCLDAMPTSATVINTSTVGPADAAELEQHVIERGRCYLHAPLIGSVPAARAGTLTVLVGGTPTESVAAVLGHVGELVPASTSSDAAALKLVANGVLGDTLFALRGALQRGAALEQPRERVLAALEHTVIGDMIQAKGLLLSEPPGESAVQFSAAALGKDLALLGDAVAAEPAAATALRTLLSEGAVEGTDDVGRICIAQVNPSHFADASVAVSPEIVAAPAVFETLHAYALGHATGDARHFRRAFLPTAHVEGYRDGSFTSWDLNTYCGLFDGPAADENDRRRAVANLSVHGDVATATMILHHGREIFTDVFVLIRSPDDEWRIANKVYMRAAREPHEPALA